MVFRYRDREVAMPTCIYGADGVFACNTTTPDTNENTNRVRTTTTTEPWTVEGFTDPTPGAVIGPAHTTVVNSDGRISNANETKAKAVRDWSGASANWGTLQQEQGTASGRVNSVRGTMTSAVDSAFGAAQPPDRQTQTQWVHGNNGSVSCQTYCAGTGNGPWNAELPAEWNGAISVGPDAVGPDGCLCMKSGAGWAQ
jgi:hypothetical protein